MSRSPLATWRRSRTALTAAIGSAVALAALAPGALAQESTFTTGKCQGAAITGQGASFQAPAHNNVFIPSFSSTCVEVGRTPGVTYSGTGSGAGLNSFGRRSGTNADGSQSRSAANRFAGTDEAPTPDQINQMNTGTDAPGDEARVQTIPVAVASTTVSVNLPDGCTDANGNLLGTIPAENRAVDPSASGKRPDRIKFTRVQLEQAFAAASGNTSETANDNNADTDLDEWGELFPGFDGLANCDTVAITRVVRADDSGTTSEFKRYLGILNPNRGWTTLPTSTARGNAERWPNEDQREQFKFNDPPTGTSNTAVDTNGNIVRRRGNPGVAGGVDSIDGSIGYVVLADARANFEQSAGKDDEYFVPLQRADNSYREPAGVDSATSTSFRTGERGSNCASVTFKNQPASTNDSWTSTTGLDSPTGYPVCSITYELAWDDYAAAYSGPNCNRAEEEQKARTVFDYIGHTLGAGQPGLEAGDYSRLPNDILAKSRAGASSIGFDKSGSACGGRTQAPPADPDGDGLTGSNDACPNESDTARPNNPRNGCLAAVVTPPPPTDQCDRLPGVQDAPCPPDTDGDGVPDSTDRCDNTRGPASNRGCPLSAFKFVGKPKLTGARVRVRVRVPGAGRLVGSSAGNATGTQTRRATKAGVVTLTLKLSPGAKRQLKRKRKLTVRVRVTFRPTGGLTSTRNVRVVLRKGRG